MSTKEQIRVLYNSGEEAVITFVQGLLDKISHLELLIESQEERIMVLEEQLKKNSRNSDKP
ncbi:MAG: IS66 family transposase, partial [Promethearchaeota archaeon]